MLMRLSRSAGLIWVCAIVVLLCLLAFGDRFLEVLGELVHGLLGLLADDGLAELADAAHDLRVGLHEELGAIGGPWGLSERHAHHGLHGAARALVGGVGAHRGLLRGVVTLDNGYIAGEVQLDG